MYPQTRMVRYRQTASHRQLCSETHLKKSDLIFPLFINESLKEKKAIQKMPGIFQLSPNTLLNEVERIANLGITSLLLFGIPALKDEKGSSAYDSDGVIQTAIKEIKKRFPHLIIIADCCLCEYTSNGHCGILKKAALFDHHATLDALIKTTLSYAESGADIIAPSGMIDGMVKTLRSTLDENHFEMTSILSYAIKFSSNFYGPFREAAGSESHFTGDRKHHQLAPTQKREALREALLDIDEGADYLMVKPGTPYLDILQSLREKTLLPLVAYQVSGEYSMLKLAAKEGLIQEQEAFMETLIGFKRAGADLIITYYADEIAKII